MVVPFLSVLLATTALHDARAQAYVGSYPTPDQARPGSSLAQDDGAPSYDILVASSPRMLPDSPYADRRRRGRGIYIPPEGAAAASAEVQTTARPSMRVSGFANPYTSGYINAQRSYGAIEPAAGSSDPALDLPPPSGDTASAPAAPGNGALALPALPPAGPATADSKAALAPIPSAATAVAPAAAPVPAASVPTTITATAQDTTPAGAPVVATVQINTTAKSEKIVDPANQAASAEPLPELKLDPAPTKAAPPPAADIPSLALPTNSPSQSATASVGSVDDLKLPSAMDTPKKGTVTITSSVPSIATAIDQSAPQPLPIPKADTTPVPTTTGTLPVIIPDKAEIKTAATPTTEPIPTVPTLTEKHEPTVAQETQAAAEKSTQSQTPATTAATEATAIVPIAASDGSEKSATAETAAADVAKAVKDESADNSQKPYKLLSGITRGKIIDRVKKPDERLTPVDAQDVVKEHKDVGLDIAVRRPSSGANLLLEKAYDALMEGKPEQAIDYYQQILETSPNNRNALFGVATTYHKMGRLVEASDYYQHLLVLDPKNKEALNNYLVLVAETSPKEAIAQLEKLEEDNPRYSPIVAQLALLYQREGNAPLALQKMARAVSLSPNNTTYLYNLAVMYDKEGVWAQAAGLYKQLVDADERGEKIPAPAREIQERLTFIRSNNKNLM